MSKCPPGTICFSNGIFVVIVLVIAGFIYAYFLCRNQQQEVSQKIHDLKQEINNSEVSFEKPIQNNKFIDYHDTREITQINETPLYIVDKTYERANNPFLAPLRSSPNQPTTSISLQGLGVPINIPTRGHTTNYQQVGILTGGDQILPLFGKLTFPGSNKWLYYTATDKFQMIKIPVQYKS